MQKDIKLKLKTFFVALLAVAGISFLFFYLPVRRAGKTFIWNYDGIYQHYVALEACRRYLLEIVDSIKGGRLVIPQWGFAIGEGADIANTLHYYAFSDPLSLLSVFFSEADLWKCYDMLIFIRIMIGAAGFILACFEFGQKRTVPVLCGALSYTFCTWTLYASVRHPQFLVPIMWLPYFIIGAERVIKENKGTLLAICCFLCGMTNFYWFYNIAVFTAIYAIVRSACTKKALKPVSKDVLHMVVPAVAGTLMSAFILYPEIRYALSNSRFTGKRFVDLLYDYGHYTSTLVVLTGPRVSASEFMLGFTWPSFIVSVLQCKDWRKDRPDPLGIFFLVALLFYIFPIFGQILEGGDYASGKWIWSLMFLSAMTLSLKMPRLLNISDGEFKAISVLTVVVIFAKTAVGLNIVGDIICVVLFFAFRMVQGDIAKEAVVACAVICCAISSCLITASTHAVEEVDLEGGVVDFDKAYRNNDAHYLANNYEDVTRYSGRFLQPNAGLSAGISSTATYWSLTPPDVSAARKKLEINRTEFAGSVIEGYDARPDLLALSSANYFLTRIDNKRSIPYGFRMAEEGAPIRTFYHNVILFSGEDTTPLYADCNIYKNDDSLPLLYAYRDTVTEDQIDDLNPLAVSETMLTTAITDKRTKISGELPETTEQKIPCTVTFERPVDENGVCEIIEGTGERFDEKYFTVHTETVPGEELYLRLKGIREYSRKAKELGIYDTSGTRCDEKGLLIIETDTGTKSYLAITSEVYRYHDGQDDFLINLGVQDDPVREISVSAALSGYYEVDDIEVWCRPVTQLKGSIAQLKSNALVNYELLTDQISGTVSCNDNVLVCCAENYSPHWEAYVDDKKVETFRTNLHYIGVEVPAGTHRICFAYNDKNKTVGAIMSILGVIFFFVAERGVFWRRTKSVTNCTAA